MGKHFASERRNMIMNLLYLQQRVTVKELCNKLNVSEATLRTDLSLMEKEDLLIRTHGGAILKTKTDCQNLSLEKESHNHIEKMKISQKASQLILNRQCILLDASSTALELARILAKVKHKLTVVTNGIQAAMNMKENPNLTVILLSGLLSMGSSALEGSYGIDLFNQINIDIFFTSSKGFTIEDGLTDYNIYEVDLKRAMADSAARIVALLDHKKMGKTYISSFASTEEIDILITDSLTPRSLIEDISSKQVEVIVV
ncbi:DeoR/GlpR family DNA-binding transcription regulator [Paenibacillus alba]|uniref:DeoR/GlpR family DNA-binding transcription regulator n=1 Tax=Paenibacillus alba TaxID=1197127 RepID=A0ABU6GB01_9BACL|nr:DeoR/GlpR family DNA-binding transcription regulator [Paenibacillus alba]MEC0229899.1 DeoR/GlpR family DNA-binding transcription regulator [Paenibacillus alba]